MTDEHDIPADRNKTDLTHVVTEGAARWLLAIGAKCVETEVCLGPKWIADLAAFWRPTPTEAVEQKLIPRRKSYPYGRDADAVAAWKEIDAERVAQFRALPEIITITVEVKTSKSDLYRDVKRKFVAAPFTDLRILAVPSGLLEPWHDPVGWWIITVHPQSGDVLHVARNGVLSPTRLEIKMSVIAAIAERRHNRTANAFFTALQKRRRVDEARA